jgi:hypothetical protein
MPKGIPKVEDKAWQHFASPCGQTLLMMRPLKDILEEMLQANKTKVEGQGKGSRDSRCVMFVLQDVPLRA